MPAAMDPRIWLRSMMVRTTSAVRRGEVTRPTGGWRNRQRERGQLTSATKSNGIVNASPFWTRSSLSAAPHAEVRISQEHTDVRYISKPRSAMLPATSGLKGLVRLEGERTTH
jgi:hypothetical protein